MPTFLPSVSPIAVVTGDLLNVRSGPWPDYPKLGEVKKGARLKIVAKDRTEGWLLVCCVNKREGWVFSGFVQIEGSLTGVPVAEAAEPPPTPFTKDTIREPLRTATPTK
ncbi:MAG: SH3 domain-containing protein [Anaerolineae bacterium]|nr:SH3 domain-containing protein [Anaerolineae bacterium]